MNWMNGLRLNDNLKEFIGQLVQLVEREAPKHEQLSGVTYMGKNENMGDINVIPLHLTDSEEKQIMDSLLRRVSLLENPDFSVTVLETWFIEVENLKEIPERVSHSVGRKSGVLLLIETKYDSIMVMGEIGPDRKILSWEKMEEPMIGLFNNLLPKIMAH